MSDGVCTAGAQFETRAPCVRQNFRLLLLDFVEHGVILATNFTCGLRTRFLGYGSSTANEGCVWHKWDVKFQRVCREKECLEGYENVRIRVCE